MIFIFQLSNSFNGHNLNGNLRNHFSCLEIKNWENVLRNSSLQPIRSLIRLQGYGDGQQAVGNSRKYQTPRGKALLTRCFTFTDDSQRLSFRYENIVFLYLEQRFFRLKSITPETSNLVRTIFQEQIAQYCSAFSRSGLPLKSVTLPTVVLCQGLLNHFYHFEIQIINFGEICSGQENIFSMGVRKNGKKLFFAV